MKTLQVFFTLYSYSRRFCSLTRRTAYLYSGSHGSWWRVVWLECWYQGRSSVFFWNIIEKLRHSQVLAPLAWGWRSPAKLWVPNPSSGYHFQPVGAISKLWVAFPSTGCQDQTLDAIYFQPLGATYFHVLGAIYFQAVGAISNLWAPFISKLWEPFPSTGCHLFPSSGCHFQPLGATSKLWIPFPNSGQQSFKFEQSLRNGVIYCSVWYKWRVGMKHSWKLRVLGV